jgi:hypothetical protein
MRQVVELDTHRLEQALVLFLFEVAHARYSN